MENNKRQYCVNHDSPAAKHPLNGASTSQPEFDTDLDSRIPTSSFQGWCTEKTPISANKFPPYIKTLFDLTDSPETDDFIRWTNDGLYMYIVDADRLCAELQRGKYFRSAKFSSVVRNLNYHRFKKLRFEELPLSLRREVDAVAATMPTSLSRHLFFHPCFQRGRVDLLGTIKGKARTPHHEEAYAINKELETENQTLKQIISEKEFEISSLRSQLQLALGNAPTGALELIECNKRPREGSAFYSNSHKDAKCPNGHFTWSDLLEKSHPFDAYAGIQYV